jgi:hypothetical protein
MSVSGVTSRRLCRSPNPACMPTSVTLAPALDSALSVNWYPAIEAELDPKVMDWLELSERIVKLVGAELFGLG